MKDIRPLQPFNFLSIQKYQQENEKVMPHRMKRNTSKIIHQTNNRKFKV